MSVQFGRWNFDGCPFAAGFLEKTSSLLRRYASDGEGSYTKAGLSLLYRGFHTNHESRLETQPHFLPGGTILLWDGRLDNREDLIRTLCGELPQDAPDISVVAAAYGRWQNACFAKLLGDWALSVWNPHDSSLTLAKDFCGTRPLFYSRERECVTWSSVLETLVLLARGTLSLDEGYLAGWIATSPPASVTPYQGICSVPPSTYVTFETRKVTTTTYWCFDSGKQVSYKRDDQYEEHFRILLSESVRRRLRSNSPVLAELSGGMDSSSIVCIADDLFRKGCADAPRLDTVSYYSDAEPHWNERPYFERVEESRGRKGFHIEVGAEGSFPGEYPRDRLVIAPGAYRSRTSISTQFAEILAAQGNRVLLSGIGGDEFLGGVPDPLPELADLLKSGNWRRYFRQLVSWALVDRAPVLQLAAQSAGLFLPNAFRRALSPTRVPSWLAKDFVRRHRAIIERQSARLDLFGPRPSFQRNLLTFAALCSDVGPFAPFAEPAYEKRYPFLDRDLLEFLFSIPPEQLLRPGKRRSLMRRALTGIVPGELLNRKRKAFVSRTPMVHLSSEWPRLRELALDLVSARLAIVNRSEFQKVLGRANDGEEVQLVQLLRTLTLEYWLRHLRDAGRLDVPAGAPSALSNATNVSSVRARGWT